MEMKMLAQKVNKIEMPEDMQERILKKCYQQMEENNMSKNVKNINTRNQTARKIFFKKSTMAAAALMLCLTGATALATTGKLKGFFRDITGWNGAVIGTAYELATDEIQLSITEVTDTLAVAVTMVNPKEAPYVYFETFGMESYEIVDMDDKVIVKGERTELEAVIDGKVTIKIPLDNVSKGEYKLIVSEMVGSAKADQPLVLSGNWECAFAK